jgi:hypothetical protein
VLGIGVNFELLRHRLAELVLRQHALNGELDNSLGRLAIISFAVVFSDLPDNACDDDKVSAQPCFPSTLLSVH